MTTYTDPVSTTRMLFLGDDRLADGFRLVGFETFPNPTPEGVDEIFRNLTRTREKTFVIVDDQIMQSGIAGLEQVLREGGRIVVVSIPQLNQPPQLISGVADRLAAMFGNGLR